MTEKRGLKDAIVESGVRYYYACDSGNDSEKAQAHKEFVVSCKNLIAWNRTQKRGG